MKIKAKLPVEIEVTVDDVFIHFDHNQVTLLIKIKGSHPDDHEKVEVTWEQMLEHADASMYEWGDAVKICARLRELADKLQAENADEFA